MDNPWASWDFKAPPPVTDLTAWDRDSAPLELAYLGQQLWTDIPAMCDAFDSAGLRDPAPSPVRVEIACPQCGSLLRAPSGRWGRIKCTVCSAIFAATT